MGKSGKGLVSARLQAVARLARTDLAARLLEHGFYAGQDQIMLALSVEDGLTPTQLANRLGVKPPTITKTINRLQAQGFLTKTGSETDARIAHVTLTETGSEAIRAIEKSVKRSEKALVKGLDKKERKALLKLLSRVEGNLGQSGAPDTDDGDDEDEAA